MLSIFISYSHQDDKYLDLLHKHLAQLKRDGEISTWTDRDILAGGNLEKSIWSKFEDSQIFIALLSPDYIASNYCYDQEFQRALERVEQGSLTIIPIIVEDCDWRNSPFASFKILPKDAKPVANWDNPNNAMVDVILNIRNLLKSQKAQTGRTVEINEVPVSKNYRIKKDFDSIQKLDFTEQSFSDIKNLLGRFIDEIKRYDNINARVVLDSASEYEFIVVNRNKIATEATVKVGISANISEFGFRAHERQLYYSVNRSFKNHMPNNVFGVAFDDYELFWNLGGMSGFFGDNQKRLSSGDIANIIWEETLGVVGIS